MKRKTFVFFSIEIGIAHIARSLAIAEELVQKGHKVYFALNKEKRSIFKSSSVTFIDIPVFANLDFLDYINKFRNHEFLMPLVAEDVKLLKKFKPNAVVVDYRFTSVAASAICDIPTFYISGSAGLPHGCNLPRAGIPKVFFSVVEPLIQYLIWSYKKQFFNAVVSCIQSFGVEASVKSVINRMSYLVPEAKGYFKARSNHLDINYVGDLSWNGFNNKIPDWIKKIKPNGKTIYISFGGTGFDSQKLIELSTTLVNKGYRVIVSASSIASVSDFPILRNLYVEKYISGKDITKRVDLVICHGGYGTMMQAVKAGVPVIANPFNPDQVIHALRFEELGVAKTTLHFEPKMLFFNWKIFQQLGKNASISSILSKVELILSQKNFYKQAAKRFQNNHVVQKPSEKEATSIIEKSINAV